MPRPVFAALLAGCATGQAPAVPVSRGGGAAPLAGLAAPSLAGGVVVMGVEFPESGTIGGHFSGTQFERRTGDIILTDGTRRSWGLAAALRVEAVMREAGYRVEQGAVPTSDAVRLSGFRFGLIGRVAELSVQSSGSTGPHRSRATTAIAWEVLDFAAGSAVLGLRTAGRGEATDSLRGAVMAAVALSFERLLTDSSFLRTLMRPRPRDLDELAGAAYAPRPEPGSRDTIVLRPLDLNPLDAGDSLLRVAAGVVTLRRPDRDETAFLITRDGLALTSYQAALRLGRAWIRFGTGVERPARVLRADRRAGVALIQVSCPDPCTTVPWTLERGGPPMPVVAIGAPFGAEMRYFFGYGHTGGPRQGPHRPRFDLTVLGQLTGGEAVARLADGAVFGITVARRHGQAALTMGEAFRALGIRADSIR